MGSGGLHNLTECWLQTNICLHSWHESECWEVIANMVLGLAYM